MQRYEERLTASKNVDLMTLLACPCGCCTTTPRSARKIGKSCWAMCWWSEYQDTDATQYALLKLLVGEAGPLYRRGR